ncbi:MAG: DoxX family protein [Flavipsychrobacter sp.]|nr:DoxX family protein [Flavipsychrobacter sp.]
MALFSQLGNYKNFGLLVMRAGLGAMMMIHGLPKITGGPEKWEQLGHAMGNLNIHFAPVFWGFMAALTEAIGGLFCILGLWFRLVSILMTIVMIVAAISHYAAGEGIAGSGHAIELAFAFFGLIFLGPGVYSVDKS